MISWRYRLCVRIERTYKLKKFIRSTRGQLEIVTASSGNMGWDEVRGKTVFVQSSNFFLIIIQQLTYWKPDAQCMDT